MSDHDYLYSCDCISVRASMPNHCRDISGRYRGCHETFATKELFAEHRHKGGCKWPGNLEDFYRKDNVWYKKEPKPEEDTQDPSRNSSSTRNAERLTTSNGSRDMRYRADRQRGRSSE